MECRKCGACCIALSVSTLKKPAGVRCPHLLPDNLCALWGKPERPWACSAFEPDPDFCGSNYLEALRLMSRLEQICGNANILQGHLPPQDRR